MKDFKYYSGHDIPRDRHLRSELIEGRSVEFASDLIEYFGGDDFATLVVNESREKMFSLGCCCNDGYVDFDDIIDFVKERYDFAVKIKNISLKDIHEYYRGLDV